MYNPLSDSISESPRSPSTSVPLQLQSPTQKPSPIEKSDSQSWIGRKVDYLSGLLGKFSEILQQIFDKCIACMCFCGSQNSSVTSDVKDEGPQKKQEKIIGAETKKTEQNKPIIQSKTNREQTKPQSETKITEGTVQDKVIESESSENEEDEYANLESDSSSEQDVELIKSAVFQLPKVPTSIPQTQLPVTTVPVETNVSSSKVNNIGTEVLHKKEENDGKNIFDQNNKTIHSQKSPTGSLNPVKNKIDEQFLDELLDQISYEDGEDPYQQDNQLNQDENQDPFYFDDNEKIDPDDFYSLPKDEIFENEAKSTKVQNKPASISVSPAINSSDLISKKSVRVSSAGSGSKAQKTLKKSLEEACVLIKERAHPETCASVFYASLEKAIDDLSPEDKLELICFLISNPQEIEEEIVKAEEEIVKACNQKLIESQYPQQENEYGQTYSSSKANKRMEVEAKISAKRIENLQKSFFGLEFSVFIGGQIFAENPNSVQQIVDRLRDCGKYEIEKETVIISQIMTKLYEQLTLDVVSRYSFETLRAYICLMENLESQGARIQAEELKIDVLRVLYSSEEDEESFSSSTDEGEFSADWKDVEKYHEGAIDFLKAYAAVQRLREFNLNKFDQKLFKTLLIDIARLIEKINPSNDLYLVLQKSCRECIGAYILKDSSSSALGEIKNEYSLLAKKLDLISFQDLQVLLDSEAFAKQRQVLQQLKEFDAEKNDIKLFAHLLQDVAGSLKEIDASHPLYVQLVVAFRKIPDLYISNYKEFQNPEFKGIGACYDSAAQKLGHKTSQELEKTLDTHSNDTQVKYEVLVQLRKMNSEKLELIAFEELLTRTASIFEEIEPSHFLYKPLESAFGTIFDIYIDILMTCAPRDRDPVIIGKIKLSYDVIAKKLNHPICPEPELLLSSDFSDKYAGLQRLEEYSSKKMEVESFVEMLSDASDFIKNIDSTHPLHARLRKAFDAIIVRYTDYAVPDGKVNSIKKPYSRLSKILGCEIVEMVVDTEEASRNDLGLAGHSNIETFKKLRKDTLSRLKALKFEFELTDTGAMAMVWKGYLDELLKGMPREAAIMLFLLTFQKELNLNGLPKILEKELGWEAYLKVLSEKGRMFIPMMVNNSEMYLNTFLKAGLSEVEATELLSAILS